MAATPFLVISGVVLILSSSEDYRERQRIIAPLDEISAMDDEEHRSDGFNNAREVPVEGELIDPTLVNPSASPTPTALRVET
jgi:hypothetical protein